MTDNKERIEQLKKELKRGYTGIEGHVVTSTHSGVRVVKLGDNRTPPTSMNFDRETLAKLEELADFFEKVQEARDANFQVEWSLPS